MSRKFSVLVASALLGTAIAAPVVGQQATSVVNVSHLKVAAPVTGARVDARLRSASGPVDVVVQLAGAPLAVANGPNSKRFGGTMPRDAQIAHSRGIRAAQSGTMAQIAALGGTEIARVRIAYNALIVRIDARSLDAVAALPNVLAVDAVGEFQRHLEETVPYIGARAVQQETGFDGTGVRVAVLDSGIDYTHAAFGGPGTAEAYAAAYGTEPSSPENKVAGNLFPTAKVVGGYDFVGETWTGGSAPLTPDDDPIDYEGHGTHVADIIAGEQGVAPGASLYAVKVCSALSSACSGVAILQGMDYALDPNGDGSMADAVDVINLSLGAPYGQIQNPTSAAAANAARAGVVVVASAGNSADRPYITGSPSSTPEVISVAQTQVPSARAVALVVNAPASIAGAYRNTETVPWAPIDDGFTGDVQFVGLACTSSGPLPSLAGKVALVDRGTCNISEKTRNATDAGAIGVLVGLVAPGDAVSFSNGGQCPAVPDGTCAPTLVIIQSTATALKNRLTAGDAVNVSVSDGVVTALVGSMVGSSSRGPSHSENAIKPDIGAPGASISAVAGSGTGTEPFGGTSGAAPMVAGAAALLLDAFPDRTPLEIKAALVNRAEPNVLINPATQPGVLAPITRIGGGEVRADRAISTKVAAWDSDSPAASLSFGYRAIVEDRAFKRTVVVRNYDSERIVLPIRADFRYADDRASGAVEIRTPRWVAVPANGFATFDVQLRVRAANLPTWTLNGGTQGGNGALLQSVEFDGYVTLGAGTEDEVRVPWQIMPRKAAAVAASATTVRAGRSLTLTNSGAQVGRVDAFALTGTSPKIQKRFLPGIGDGFAVVDLKSVGARLVGIGDGQFGVQFAINTFGERTHPLYPAGFEVQVDTNRDGTPEFAVYPSELTGFNTTGQMVVNVFSFATGTATPYFFADADLNSANVIMTAPLAVMGLTPNSQFDFTVLAYDNYFTGNVTDAIEGMRITLGAPKFFATGIPAGGVPVGGSASVTIQPVAGGASASPSQTGILLMYRDGKPRAEAETIVVR